MDEAVRQALAIDRFSPERDRTIDITTTGARSGQPRRIETWFYRVGDRIYLTGLPGRRDWYANLRANPRFTFHLVRGVQAELAATARPVTDAAERRRVITEIVTELDDPGSPSGTPNPAEADSWVAGSPLVEVIFEA
jgi:deazaflavin-dependent oxidoreductase (nitroreductase family)